MDHNCHLVHHLPPVTPIIGGLFTLLGVPANIIVLLVGRQAKIKRSTLVYLLLNLALTDIINLLATETFLIFEITSRPIWGVHLAFVRLILIPNDVAILTLATVAMERYNALVRTMAPAVANLNGGKRQYVFIPFMWLFAFAIDLPPILITLIHRVSHCDTPDIGHTWETFEHVSRIVSLVVFHAIPLVIYSYCYSKIIKGVFVDRTVLGGKSFPNAEALNEKKTLVRTTITVTVVFIISCTSATVGLTVNSFGKGRDVLPKQFHSLVLLLKCLSSTVNPYLYCLQSRKYRSEVRQLLFARKGKSEIFSRKLIKLNKDDSC